MITAIYVFALGQFALNWAERKASGGMPGAFMSWGAGARSLGMGKAFVALADDATATYWNPAGLAKLYRSELTALHSILWGGTVYDFISFVQPTKWGGTFGFSGTRLFLGGFQGRDAQNRVTHSFSDIQSAYGASYGQKVLETLSIGATLKKMSHTLDNHTSGSYILDIGGIYSPVEYLNVGLNLQNLLALSYGTADELPVIARMGVNYKLLREKLSIGADLRATIGWKEGIPLHIGAEYWAMSYLALRMGMDPNEFNLGFGLKYEDYGLDYAYATHELGGSHRISASVSFGPSVANIKRKTAGEYEEEGNASYRSGMFSQAVKSFEKAYGLNPSDKDLARKLNILSKITRIIPSKTEDTEKAELIRRGVKEYMENENHKVLILALNYIITEDPTDNQAKKLLRLIGSLENIDKPRIRVAEGMSLTEYKLHQALQYFYAGDYAKAIDRCQEVLVVEPKNAQAYKRMGSAFYSIGNEEKALKAWKMSLKYNPEDDSLKNFMNKIIRQEDNENTQKSIIEEMKNE